jgi:AraC-like DNA-binding protein
MPDPAVAPDPGDDPKLQISKIAWLLGFIEVSAFTHAFKRWTGKTPSQMRTAGAY